MALRFLSKTNSNILGYSDEAIEWGVDTFNSSFKLFTRRYPSSDLGIMNQVLGNEEYRPLINLFEGQKSLNIIDAGANVGFASIYFKSVFPNAEILCLEIDSNNAAQLRKNIEYNKLKNITVLENALWKSNAYLEIKRDFRDMTECSYYVEESLSETPLKGYDTPHYLTLMNWSRVDLLKIDIEGAERYLFETKELADKVLENTHVLAIEIHDEFNIRSTIEQHLDRHQFKYFNHGDVTIATRVRMH